MVNTAIFDLDNTIVDSEPLVSEAYCRVLLDCGINPELRSSGLVHEVGRTGIMEEFMSRYSIRRDREELRNLWWKHYMQILENSEIRIMPGAIKALGEAFRFGLRIGLATTSRSMSVDLILDRFELRPWFDCIVTRDDVPVPKPAPDIFLAVLGKLQTEGKCSVVFEDSQAGAEAGKTAGCQVVVIPNRYTRCQSFPPETIVIDSLEVVDRSLIQRL